MLLLLFVTLITVLFVGYSLKVCWEKEWVQLETYLQWSWLVRIGSLIFIGTQVYLMLMNQEWHNAAFAFAALGILVLLFWEIKLPDERSQQVKKGIRVPFHR